jgi:hypothetical protein
MRLQLTLVRNEYTIQMSANVPPALANGDEPNIPAISREIINVANELGICFPGGGVTCILGKSRGNLKDRKHEPRDEVHRSASPSFGQWRPD